jgi:shikimate kinase
MGYGIDMEERRQVRNLALVGFMGTGKSSVGRLVARQLRFAFVDSDSLIERRLHKKVADVFSERGEPWFRAYEHALVEEFEAYHRTVFSTGGGMAANAVNLASLKRHALVICLWASPETIYQRVRRRTHRPLLMAPDPMAKIRTLLTERDFFYRQADVLINTEWRQSFRVAQQVVFQFRLISGEQRPRS